VVTAVQAVAVAQMETAVALEAVEPLHQDKVLTVVQQSAQVEPTLPVVAVVENLLLVLMRPLITVVLVDQEQIPIHLGQLLQELA
jgi:hypothetical protein